MATTKGEAAVAAVSSPLYVTSDENNGGGLSGTRTTKSFVVPKKDRRVVVSAGDLIYSGARLYGPRM